MDRAAEHVLDRNFLVVRAKLLEISATFDRIDRAEGSVESDPRIATIGRAIELLASDVPDRAEQIQLLFSRDYDSQWRKNLRPAPR